MKLINFLAMTIAFLCAGHSLATDNFEERSKNLWQCAKRTLTVLNLDQYFCDQENPHSKDAQKLSMEWIKKYEIIKDASLLNRINMANFGQLIGKAHPDAPLIELSIVVDFVTWLFIYDDKTERRKNKDDMRASHARSLGIINGASIREDDTPLNKGLYDVMQRIKHAWNPSTTWLSRFANNVKDYCEATIWEFENRDKKQIPTLASYQKNRPNTGATKPMFDFIELIDKIEVPQDIYGSAYFSKMLLLAQNLIDDENDIGSAWKELEDGIHNIIFVINALNDNNIEGSFNFAASDLSENLKEFLELPKSLPINMNDQEKKLAAIYYNGLKLWVAANHFWAKNSPRYNPPKWTNILTNN